MMARELYAVPADSKSYIHSEMICIDSVYNARSAVFSVHLSEPHLTFTCLRLYMRNKAASCQRRDTIDPKTKHK